MSMDGSVPLVGVTVISGSDSGVRWAVNETECLIRE